MNPTTNLQATKTQSSQPRMAIPGKDYKGCAVRPNKNGELKWHNVKGQALDLVSDEEALEILG